ncbi:MAG TPA: hypothetical protein VFK02_17175 [Kofleriaceae bacterium]|nr:hypothetical protein [Kofleriaceae bacterium]
MRRILPMLSTCLWACGDNTAVPPDVLIGPPPFETAPHAAMPRIFEHGNVVLSRVELVTLTYDDYADRAQVEAFGDAVVDSTWFKSVGLEYNLVGGVHLKKVALGPAPTSLTRIDLEAVIRNALLDHLAPPPSPIGNQLLYLLYVPPSVALGPDLAGIHGYHDILMLDHVEVPYAVVLDDGSGIATTTTTAGHELIDAATNPYAPPSDGYYADLPKTDPWSLVSGEIADLCEGESPVYLDVGGFAVPRVYSNRAASAGAPPCGPRMPGDTWTDVTAEPARMQVVKRGFSVTFELTGWSTEAVPAWQLRTRAADFSMLTQEQMHPELSSNMINNGETVTLTLYAPRDATYGVAAGVYILSGPDAHPWAVGFFVQ